MKLLFNIRNRYWRRLKMAPQPACKPETSLAAMAASSVLLSFTIALSTPAADQKTSLVAAQSAGPATPQAAVPKEGESPAAAAATANPSAGQALSPDIKAMSAFYRQGKYVQAELLGRKILQTSPTNLEAHYLLGNVYFSLKDSTDAAQQYNYCIKAGPNTAVAKLAKAALATLNASGSGAPAAEAAGAGADASGTTAPAATAPGATPSTNPAVLEKPVSQAVLKHAESILLKAQDSIAFKKKQLDIVITHTEEFARSRIKDIPPNIIYRRMSAFAGIQAARDNEDYYPAANYDRPAEVAKIRATETAKVRRYIDEYNGQERSIVTGALKEVDALLGGTSDPDAKLQVTTSAAPLASADATKPKQAANTYEACGMCGITSQKEREGHRVIVVATGSAAHRAGLTPGDLIVQSTFIPGADMLKLTIRRIGKHYSLVLHPQASAISAAVTQRQTPSKISAAAVAAAAATAAKPTSSQLAWARIKDSDIVFVEDMSANMRLPLGETGLSRWDWAAGRIVEFADGLSRGNNMGFTLVQAYQSVYELYRDQNPASLRQRLAGARAMDASNLTTPLEFVANDYFDSHSLKPLLIMVFTDGRPERGESLEVAVKAILDRAKSPDQVRLVFFQIGDDSQGTAMLQMLDNDLTYAGHKHDVVDYVNFAELQESGVSRALVDAYERPRAPGRTTPPPMSQALAVKLEQVRKQIAAAH